MKNEILLKTASSLIHGLPPGRALALAVEIGCELQQSTIKELALSAGVSERYLRMLLNGERGVRGTRLKQIKELAAPIHLDIGTITGNSNDSEPTSL